MRLDEKLWDVLVLGGGLAGAAAAREAARAGRDALLIERRPLLGWELCWAHAPEIGGGIGTLAEELLAGLESAGALAGGQADPAVAELVLDEIAGRAGVNLLYYAQPVRLAAEDGRAIAAIAATKGGQRAYRARTFIDATATGLLWKQCGAEPQGAREAASRFSLHFWVPKAREHAADLGDIGPVQNVTLKPGVWDNALELAFALDGDSITDARLALPEVLRAARESLPAEAIVTHSAPELLPLRCARLSGRAGEAHPRIYNLFGAGAWLLDECDADSLTGKLMTAGARSGQAAARLAPEQSEPPSAPIPAQVAPPRHQCEVLVAGGGTAGALAALAAGRREHKVTVLEAGTSAGGIGTSGGIHMYYCGIPGGLQDEVDARVEELAPLFAPPEAVKGFHPEAKKLALEVMLAEANVETRYGTMLVGAVAEQEAGLVSADSRPAARLREAIAASSEGNACWSAKVFIDSTGDADLAAWAGAASIFGREGDGLPHAYSLSAGRVADGRMQIVNFDAGYTDPTDPEDITRARRAALELHRLQRFSADQRPTYVAPLLGLRSSRQVVCDYQLTFPDQVGGARFEDAIAESFGHYDNHGADYEFDSDQAVFWVWGLGHWHRRLGCEIPYRCLLPRNVEGLLIACRAAGVTYDAHMMLRMQNDMQRLGEAAGLAASLCVEGGCTPRSIDIHKLRAQLTASGALRPPGEKPRFLEMREQALGEIKALPPPQQAAELVAELDGPRASEALLALAGGPEELLPELRKAARGENPALRFRASAALAMRRDPAALPGLLEAVERRRAPVPEPACQGIRLPDPPWLPAVVLLGRLGSKEAVPVLCDVLGDADAPFDALLAAARSLGRIGDRGAAPALEKLLARKDIKTTRDLQSSSGGLKSPPLDARWQLELTAAEALARIGVPRREVVERYLDDERALVRRRARQVATLLG